MSLCQEIVIVIITSMCSIFILILFRFVRSICLKVIFLCVSLLVIEKVLNYILFTLFRWRYWIAVSVTSDQTPRSGYYFHSTHVTRIYTVCVLTAVYQTLFFFDDLVFLHLKLSVNVAIHGIQSSTLKAGVLLDLVSQLLQDVGVSRQEVCCFVYDVLLLPIVPLRCLGY